MQGWGGAARLDPFRVHYVQARRGGCGDFWSCGRCAARVAPKPARPQVGLGAQDVRSLSPPSDTPAAAPLPGRPNRTAAKFKSPTRPPRLESLARPASSRPAPPAPAQPEPAAAGGSPSPPASPLPSEAADLGCEHSPSRVSKAWTEPDEAATMQALTSCALFQHVPDGAVSSPPSLLTVSLVGSVECAGNVEAMRRARLMLRGDCAADAGGSELIATAEAAETAGPVPGRQSRREHVHCVLRRTRLQVCVRWWIGGL